MTEAFSNWFQSVKLKWILVGTLTYFIAAFSGVYFLISPQFRRYHEAIDKQVGLDETYINLISLDVEAAIKRVEIDLEELENLESYFHKRLHKGSVNSILPTIDRYCRKSRLEVITLEPVSEIKFLRPKYQKRFIRTVVSGKYTDFLSWLLRLESNPDWILIEELTITPTGKGSRGRFEMLLGVLQEKSGGGTKV